MSVVEWIISNSYFTPIIRMDLTTTSPQCEAIKAVLIFYWEDDDGPVLGRVDYSVPEGGGRAELEFSFDNQRKEFEAFLSDTVANWENSWKSQRKQVFRLIRTKRHKDEGERDQISERGAKSLFALRQILRLQGALELYYSIGTNPGGSDWSFWLSRAIGALDHLVMDGRREMNALTEEF